MLVVVLEILPNSNKTLDTRDQAQILFENLKDYCPNCNEIIIDFTDIDFMSRSFADQFHKERMKFQSKHKIQVYCENENDQIHQILIAVSKTQNSVSRNIKNFQFHSIFTKEQLFQFFNTL